MICIFCDQPADSSKNIEHVIPESLGNKDTFILKPGVVCDECNNFFGRKIEQKVLDIPFFKQNRHFKSVPNKDGKIPPDKGFMIYPDVPVIVTKGKRGDHATIEGHTPLKKRKDGLDMAVFIPVFAFSEVNNTYFSRFLAKVGIEALAIWAIRNNMEYIELITQVSLTAIRKYARRGMQNMIWPYSVRRIHHPDDLLVNPENGDSRHILCSMRFINAPENQLFHQVLIYGTEFTIDMLQSTTDQINEWFKANNNRSPVMEGVIQTTSDGIA